MDWQIWVGVIEKSATVALAVFAIWMLNREYKDRLRDEQARLEAEKEARQQERGERKEERAQLLAVIDRNTQAWQQATQSMAEVGSGMAMLVGAIETSRQDVNEIRVLLAQRPCVANGVPKPDHQGKGR